VKDEKKTLRILEAVGENVLTLGLIDEKSLNMKRFEA